MRSLQSREEHCAGPPPWGGHRAEHPTTGGTLCMANHHRRGIMQSLTPREGLHARPLGPRRWAPSSSTPPRKPLRCRISHRRRIIIQGPPPWEEHRPGHPNSVGNKYFETPTKKPVEKGVGPGALTKVQLDQERHRPSSPPPPWPPRGTSWKKTPEIQKLPQ